MKTINDSSLKGLLLKTPLDSILHLFVKLT
jgi:hypothetical protein